MRFASLGSGSEGNGLLIEAQIEGQKVRVLLDCGFGRKEALQRIGNLGLDPYQLDAIIVTHEHGDHSGGVASLAKALKVPVYTSMGTAIAAGLTGRIPELLRIIRADDNDGKFSVKGLGIEAITVPHDAREPLQFVVQDGAHRLGVLTDLGHISEHVAQRFVGLTAMVLECNHDPGMLAQSDYPAHLKRRIAGGHGHLSNERAGQLLASMERSQLAVVVAAHLSRQNNTRELAAGVLAECIGAKASDFWVADQDDGVHWLPAR